MINIYFIEYKESLKIFTDNVILDILADKVEEFAAMLKEKAGDKKINFVNILEV